MAEGQGAPTSTPDYSRRVQGQIAQYAEDAEAMHDKPRSFHYWSQRYIAPRLFQVFDSDQIDKIFLDRLLDVEGLPPYRFASIGAGECRLEISIAARMRDQGIQFEFDCYELSPVLAASARSLCATAGLSDQLRILQMDINHSKLERSYNGIMAHHSLHHFVELEAIFDEVKRQLVGNGCFVTYDMIGRNGHMRWPEALEIVEKIWPTLAKERRYNHQFNSLWHQFVNWDCSESGFEGIRAQDILPNLLSRFHFTHCVAFGGLSEVFFDLGFGKNYNPDVEGDRAFIDFVEYLNSMLLEYGIIKPTIMFAAMRNRPGTCRYIGNLSPAFCLRVPS